MNKKVTIIAAILVFSLMASVAFAGQEGAIQPKAVDKPSKNIDDIKKKLIGNDDIRVIITLKEEATDQNINKLQAKTGIKVGKKGWKSAYPNGFAATIKRNQLDNIKKDPSVARVDMDEQKQIQLETANYWSGATKARLASPTGYGVDGDRDGKKYNYTPTDIVIAVVDTGIDPMHKDLTGVNNGGTKKIIGWHDSVANLPDPYDDHGHGTHVSSIAAGEGDDNPRYKGVAPGAALVGIKVCNSGGWCYDSDMLDGINWVITNKVLYGIEIMTMSIGSFGSSDGTDPVSTAVNNAFNAGLVVTIAAGNSGDQKYTISSPGAAEKAITVAAMADPGYKLRMLPAGVTNQLDVPISPDKKSAPTGAMDLRDNGFYLAWFSSRGPTADNRMKPDIAAPGVYITAAEGVYPNTASMHGGYVTWSGTSMATPFIAGVAALIKDANYSLNNVQIKNIIRASGEDYGASGCDIDYGCGSVRVMQALKLATGVAKTDQWVPTHLRNWTFFGDNDFYIKNYPTLVTDDNYPVASTLIMYDWSGYWPGIDLDLLLTDPNGGFTAWSAGYSRQETAVLSPDSLGVYNASVLRYAGSGRYVLDRSFK